MDETTTQGGTELDLEKLSTLTPEELVEFAKAQVAEVEKLKADRKASEKGVKELIDKQKELETTRIPKDEVATLVKQETEKHYVQSTLSNVKGQLPEGAVEEFEAEFNDITEGKQLTSENIDKYVQKALKIIGKPQGTVTALNSNATAPAKSSTKAQETARKEEAKAFNEEYDL